MVQTIKLSREKVYQELVRITIFKTHICLEKGVFVSVLKGHFDMFSKVKKVIADRILLALGVNPYQSYEKLNWQKFLRFKKILITRDAALVDIIQFIIKVSFCDD